MKSVALCLAGVVAMVIGVSGAWADGGFVDRDGKAGDAIENHYPISMSKPTVEEITKALERLLERADKANPATIVDSATKQEVTDFSAANPNARINMGGYPMGVLHAGMLAAAEATKEKAFSDFTAKRLALIADHYDYFAEQAKTVGVAKSSFKNFLEPRDLDACGAWGAALVKAKQAGVGPDLSKVIGTWADYVSEKQFRLEDGTLARNRPVPNALWGDDMYMSIPFLAQMYKDTGKTEYLDLAVKQGLQIPARLFHPEKGLYSHFWFASNSELPVERYWGRVNGWCLMAECELLDVMPEDHPQRAAILKIVRRHIKGLAERQSPMGLWHQLLDRDDTFLETSCTAMFTYGMAHAVNKGWISPYYGGVAQAGWNGVMSRQNKDGGFDGTCIGTDVSSDAAYYAYRPVTDDVHGYGPVMMAGAEMIKLLKNPNVVVKYVRGGIYVYESKEDAAGKSE
jgi:unsaturated rhamnogalacturonyl hydrolase